MYAHPTGAVMMPAGGHPAAYFHHGGYPYGATAPGPGYIRDGQVLYPERQMPQRTTTDTTIVSARRPKPNTVITSPVVSYRRHRQHQAERPPADQPLVGVL